MQVCGDVCPLGLPDPLRLLRAQIPPEAHAPRRRDQRGAHQHRDRGDPHIPQPGQPPALSGQNDHADGRQDNPDPQTKQARPPTAGGDVPDQPAASLGIVELGPGKHGSAGDGQQRDEHAEAKVEAVLLGEEHRADEEQPQPDHEVAHRLIDPGPQRGTAPGHRGGPQ